MSANYKIIKRNSNGLVNAIGTIANIRQGAGDQVGKVVNVSIVYDRRYPVRKDGNPVMETDENGNQREKWNEEKAFIDTALWGPAAASFTGHVGDQVRCSFHLADLEASPYMDKEGKPAASLKVRRCDNIEILASKQGEGEPVAVALPATAVTY